MASLDSLLKLPRRVGVTYRDITAPGEQYQSPLPVTGATLTFSVGIGPVAAGTGGASCAVNSSR